jgi:hypothetical protein
MQTKAESTTWVAGPILFNKLSVVGALFSKANQAKKWHLGSVLACQILEELTNNSRAGYENIFLFQPGRQFATLCTIGWIAVL